TLWRSLERETGIEPATNSLEGCDSTTELLPPSLIAHSVRNFGGLARCHCRFSPSTIPRATNPTSTGPRWLASRSCERSDRSAKAGGEGRIRTFEGAGPTDLQSAAFDRFATSPKTPTTP